MAIRVEGYSIALDTRDSEANVNFVSHAHSDHISGISKEKKTISSVITKDLIEARKPKSQLELLNLNKAKLLNAGHILGSKQFYGYSEEEGLSVLYSGDYQMQESLVAEKIETHEADVLIIDSTYPYPDVTFDDRSEVTTTIQKYITEKTKGAIVLFGAYSLGKAQELNKIANEVGIAPLVDNKIHTINQIYSKHGVKLDYSLLDDSAKGSFVGIVGMSKLDQYARELSQKCGRQVFTAVATGFAKMMTFGTDVQFSLSDHADFKQATDYINLCNPKTIYTYGNRESAEMFARNLSGEGYNASVFGTRTMLALNK